MSKRITKGRDKIFDGVCSGIANQLGVDPLWIRLLVVIFAEYTLFPYVVLMFIMPEGE